MKTAPAILIAVLALLTAGCVLHGKPKTAAPPPPQPAPAAPAPAPPPEPLSIPQTQVQLPPAQPFDPESLTPAPAPEPAPEAPAPGRSSRRSAPAAPPHAEPAPPPVVAPEIDHGPVREVLSDAERTRLKNSADIHKRDVRSWLSTSKARRLGPNNPTIVRIQAFLKACEAAEEKDDMREAYDMADRAFLLMRELQGVR